MRVWPTETIDAMPQRFQERLSIKFLAPELDDFTRRFLEIFPQKIPQDHWNHVEFPRSPMIFPYISMNYPTISNPQKNPFDPQGALRSRAYSVALGPPRKVLADAVVATRRCDDSAFLRRSPRVFSDKTGGFFPMCGINDSDPLQPYFWNKGLWWFIRKVPSGDLFTTKMGVVDRQRTRWLYYQIFKVWMGLIVIHFPKSQEPPNTKPWL